MPIHKLFISLVAIVALVAGLVAVPVSAEAASADVTQENSNTGPRSTNRNRSNIRKVTRQNIRNNATANNSVNVAANTGGNRQNRNTTAGDITSGDIDVAGSFTNELNQNGCGCPTSSNGSSADISQTNDTTGPRSTNTNRVNLTERTVLDVRNDATVNNTVNVAANTGDNRSNENTTGGDIDSGNVSVDADFSNTLN